MTRTTVPRVWLITGASSGLGLAAAEHVLKQGDIAVATLRKPEALNHLKAAFPASQLLVLKLDVTVPEDITAAFAAVRERFGRLDVVFNNAGVGLLSEIEGTPEEDNRRMWEINFWGHWNVTREAVKFFREVNPKGVGGRIIQSSSIAGLDAYPGIGMYSATKFAMEGATEALAKELRPEWNIKVTLVEFGAFKTKGMDNATFAPVHPAYVDEVTGQSTVRSKWTNVELSGDPDKAASALYKLSLHPEPPLHLLLGKDAIQVVKQKLTILEEEVNAFAAWSEDINLDLDTQSTIAPN